MNPLVESWLINDRINHYFLAALTEDQLKLKVEKAKSVGGQFGHIHSVRLMWLKAAAPDLNEGLEKADEHSLASLGANLEASAQAIAKLIERGLEEGRIKGFKPHPTAFVCYLVAHEATHRAHAELALRQCGVPLSDKVAYGQWEWGVR